jgi:hypothetical protein
MKLFTKGEIGLGIVIGLASSGLIAAATKGQAQTFLESSWVQALMGAIVGASVSTMASIMMLRSQIQNRTYNEVNILRVKVLQNIDKVDSILSEFSSLTPLSVPSENGSLEMPALIQFQGHSYFEAYEKISSEELAGAADKLTAEVFVELVDMNSKMSTIFGIYRDVLDSKVRALEKAGFSNMRLLQPNQKISVGEKEAGELKESLLRLNKFSESLTTLGDELRDGCVPAIKQFEAFLDSLDGNPE